MGFAGRTRAENAWYIDLKASYDLSRISSEYRGWYCRVKSQTWQDWRYWTIWVEMGQNEGFWCSCPDYGTWRQKCKHILAVQLFTEGYRGEVAPFRDPPHPPGWYSGPIPQPVR